MPLRLFTATKSIRWEFYIKMCYSTSLTNFTFEHIFCIVMVEIVLRDMTKLTIMETTNFLGWCLCKEELTEKAVCKFQPWLVSGKLTPEFLPFPELRRVLNCA